MKSIPRLTDLEISIMKVLWDSDKHLTIQEMNGHLDGLSVASITQAIKHLVNKKSVVVSEHILVSNVYARTFKTCYTREEFLAEEFKRLQKCVLGINKANVAAITATLFNNVEDEELNIEQLDELLKLIEAKKEKLTQ